MFFEKIYIAEIDKVSSGVEDSFLMCGDKNWDYYFTAKDDSVETEELNNVTFIESNTPDKFKDFIKDLECIDFSLENDGFSVLYYEKK